jgi:hypothetical protein
MVELFFHWPKDLEPVPLQLCIAIGLLEISIVVVHLLIDIRAQLLHVDSNDLCEQGLEL